MHICHITPHLPPDQAANALLPFQLGEWARDRGDRVTYVTHPPRAGPPRLDAGPVITIPPLHRHDRRGNTFRIGAIRTVVEIWRRARGLLRSADIVHVHSNGLLSEIGALIAHRYRRPVVLTLYGTEIWHYSKPSYRPDLFGRAYHLAAHVTFYSHGLQMRAGELGLARHGLSTIYPPVADHFRPLASARGGTEHAHAVMEARRELGLRNRHVLLNVKRLHPLAGQRYLLEALSEVIRTHPDTHLVMVGTGPLEDSLKQLARSAGIEGHVTFAGSRDNRSLAKLYALADAFVLPSLLEACPTVALEALACGTPVISSDNPGGIELNDLFGFDVTVVPRENVRLLTAAVVNFLENKRRVRQQTLEIIDRDFRPANTAKKFWAVYENVLGAQRVLRTPSNSGRPESLVNSGLPEPCRPAARSASSGSTESAVEPSTVSPVEPSAGSRRPEPVKGRREPGEARSTSE